MPPASGSSDAAAASDRPDPTSAPPARRTVQPPRAKLSLLGMVAPAVPRQYDHLEPTTDNWRNVTHRDEIRRHLCRRPRPHPQRRDPREARGRRRATRSPSWCPPWRASPISSSVHCQGLSPLHDAREYDTVVATGEQVTTGLLAIALQEIGVEARSWQGWQIPIRTDNAHGKARIADDRGRRTDPPHESGPGRRGGRLPGHRARTTASPRWAAAAPIPRRWRWRPRCRPTAATSTPTSTASTPPIRASSRQARKLARIAYEEMLELASVGAKVLQTRSVELAMNERVRVQVLSSFTTPTDAGHAGGG